MKIVMGASPLLPERAEKRHWTVTVIRAFGFLQIIGTTLACYAYLRQGIQRLLMSLANMHYDSSLIVAAIISAFVGLVVGFISSAFIFAISTFLEDVHTIKGYLRDMKLTGQYYDE